jgi:hypothetical protein
LCEVILRKVVKPQIREYAVRLDRKKTKIGQEVTKFVSLVDVGNKGIKLKMKASITQAKTENIVCHKAWPFSMPCSPPQPFFLTPYWPFFNS